MKELYLCAACKKLYETAYDVRAVASRDKRKCQQCRHMAYGYECYITIRKGNDI